jgi:AcrR family transcriptional regulator
VPTFHPTKEKLVHAFLELLKTQSWNDITSEMVLDNSGITKGSLYHHFEDFGELIETVRIRRFSHWVDASIEVLTEVVTNSVTKEQLIAALHEVSVNTQSFSQSKNRLERTQTISLTNDNPRFATELAKEQQRLTDALTDIIREAQEKGLITSAIKAKVLAVFIQSYTLGKIVDDINPERVDETEWVKLIDEIVLKVLSI